MEQGNESFLEWIQTRQRRELSEGEMRLSDGKRMARQRLECVELAPAFGARVVVEVVARGEKAPASRTHSKRFAQSSAREAFKASLWIVDHGKSKKIYLLP